MNTFTRLTLIGLLALAAASLSGCTRTRLYLVRGVLGEMDCAGTTVDTMPAKPWKVLRAVQTAFADLSITGVQPHYDDNDNRITVQGLHADATGVAVIIVPEGEESSKVFIRVDHWGNENRQLQLQMRIKAHL